MGRTRAIGDIEDDDRARPAYVPKRQAQPKRAAAASAEAKAQRKRARRATASDGGGQEAAPSSTAPTPDQPPKKMSEVERVLQRISDEKRKNRVKPMDVWMPRTKRARSANHN